MMHGEFAEMFTERLEACADVLGHEVRPEGRGATATRANELWTAAAMAREEAPPPEAQA